ncbi:voltage-gated purine nucleotide uniporter SLC17A9 isoform X4 [Manis javanica]|uniref:voltage-gated purine nucleotide uniporter SLC17A9 isoform X4 n=1 Tax=Manis javanica TaxID=9974 RepID=UPI003C6D1FD4
MNVGRAPGQEHVGWRARSPQEVTRVGIQPRQLWGPLRTDGRLDSALSHLGPPLQRAALSEARCRPPPIPLWPGLPASPAARCRSPRHRPPFPSRIGGEKVILLSASAWGLITAATPLLARLGSAHLVVMTSSRVLTGLLQGVYFPALTSLLSQKVRTSERAFVYSTVGAGSQFGTLLTGAAGSLLLDWYGWPSVFYFSGGLTLLWACYVYRSHPGLGRFGARPAGVQTHQSSLETAFPEGFCLPLPPTLESGQGPRCRILSPATAHRAAIASQLSSACSFFILLSWLPTFFKETFPSSKGWVFNVVPWLVAIPASMFSGFLSDWLINQGYRTITVRKFMQVMGLGLSSIFALCLGHTSSFCKSVVFASASIGLQTFNHSGISVNIQDLAPSCAGFLFGVANTAGALAGVVGVCLGGYLTETAGSWTPVFNLVAVVSSLGLGAFLVFGEAQRVDLSPARQDL